MLVKGSKIVLFVVHLFLLFGSAIVVFSQESEPNSVEQYIDSSKNRNFNFDRRQHYLFQAYDLFLESDEFRKDPKLLAEISFAFYRLNDSVNFRSFNRKARLLSVELQDSISLANNYWDLGNFYSRRGVKDSAYWSFSSAQKIFHAIDSSFYSARMLLNMAIMQSDVRDYAGSEIATMEAIKIFKPLNEYRQLYRAYNNLAVNFNNMDNYEKSLFYHRKALEYQMKIETDNTFKETTLNNIGVCYAEQEKYEQAIENYNKALTNKELKVLNPNIFAKLIDNRAHSRFRMNDTVNVQSSFYEALKIRDSLGDLLGQSINKLHLAEFYLYKGDTLKAIDFSNSAKKLAQKSNNNREILSSLLFLAKIDSKKFVQHTNEYIGLSNNLLKEERATRNKFARIRFETDEFIEENIRLDRRNRLITLIASFIILIGVLLFIIKNQQNKNKELRFQRQQQKANEEIYKLMISQQNKMDEGSRNEKHRISKELHDGVLGRLFGTRLLLGTVNAKNDQETIEQREKYIDELQSIEEEIRNISHELHADAQIKNIGYPSLVESLLDSQSKIGQYDAILENDENIGWEQIDGGVKMHVYRILQEGLQNITKYAKAKRVAVRFSLKEALLHIQIMDDGVGFDINAKNSGIGLMNIKSRISNLAGSFELTSTPGNGTTIDLNIPITT